MYREGLGNMKIVFLTERQMDLIRDAFAYAENEAEWNFSEQIEIGVLLDKLEP